MQENKIGWIMVLLIMFVTANSYAQNPWQQDKGEALISPYISHYRASSFRSRNGEKIPFQDEGLFTNYNPRLYFSLPLKGYKVNFFGSIPLFINKFDDTQQSQKNVDLGDLELGGRFHIRQLKNHYLMGAITAFVPAYQNNNLPYTGFERFGMEGRLILAGNSPWMGESNNFHKIEGAFRQFFPGGPSQTRVYASQGLRITSKIVLLGELDGIISFSNESQFFENNLQLVSDFTMVKAALNIGYEFTPDFSLYGGTFHDILNRNSGIGSGFQVFSVIRMKSK
ncbi:hypothetical protein ACFOUP_05365 [Belliella kenyensis]|uniref:Transporter n=1 Tax=Belliella kenyensis TaxID=1472724 RepID=A0ABV8EHM1_9BACT|nr:hypothetical protein [Belliella kenyensis]MCH7402723.1 hypothetical protein [Belliella kenyensis]MDN3603729.1 hypothetical protein [Belliella kenyensis]